MCGLVGIVGDLTTKEETTIKKLLMFDYFRGPDSTGFAGIRHSGECKIAKYHSSPPTLFEMQRYKEAASAVMCKVFMGHNRAATRGAITETNAHPFHCGKIIGAHNGTLETKDKLALEERLGQRFEVDSQALFAAIDAFGIDEVIPMLTVGENASNSSAYALTWYDQNDGTMNFLRNKFRPLWYGWEEGFKRLLYGSTWEIIDNAVRMEPAIYKMYVEDKTRHKYWQFEENMHYRFKVSDLKSGNQIKPTVRELKGKEPVAASSTSNNNPFGFSPNTHTHITTPTPKNGSTTTSRGSHTQGSSSTKVKSRVDFLHLLGDIGSPFAGFIDKDRFADLSKYGCSWCSAPIPDDAKGVTVYDRDDLILCPGCSGNADDLDPATRVYVRAAQIDALI